MSKKQNKIEIPLFDIKLSSQTKKEVNDTLNSGWLTSGPKVKQFEKTVSSYLGMKHSVAINSCTLGLQMILSAIGSNNTKEVITSPFTFVGTIEAIMHTGARPIFADINPKTLNIDPDEVARKITDRTIAVMPVDIAGYPSNYDRLKKVCDRLSVPLISDSAHAIAAKYKGKSIPKYTDASVYSFYSTKNLTCGEGGMVVSRHKELIDAIRLFARHGFTKNTFDRNKKKDWHYDIAHLGFKGNMSDVHAAIGLGQFTTFEKDQIKREKVAGKYIKKLSHLSEYIELPFLDDNITHGWHLFIIKLHLSKLKIDRNEFIRLMNKKGIECGVHYQPIFEFEYYRDALGFTEQILPNSAYAGRRVISLPFYVGLKKDGIDYVCRSIEEIISKFS